MTAQRRTFDDARVKAELAGRTQYFGRPCQVDPDHVRDDNTTLRDTFKYQCVLCRQTQNTARNQKRKTAQQKETAK